MSVRKEKRTPVEQGQKRPRDQTPSLGSDHGASEAVLTPRKKGKVGPQDEERRLERGETHLSEIELPEAVSLSQEEDMLPPSAVDAHDESPKVVADILNASKGKNKGANKGTKGDDLPGRLESLGIDSNKQGQQ